MKAKATKPATEAKPATKVPEPALKAMRPVRKMATLAAAGGGGSSPWYTTLVSPFPMEQSGLAFATWFRFCYQVWLL